MTKHLVSLVRYKEPRKSVRQAVELCQGLRRLRPGARVLVKPNVVFWSKEVEFPAWGVVTTSRVVADVVELLRETGAGQIIIGEGTVVRNPKDTATAAHAYETLGYQELAKRYGAVVYNLFERPFKKVDLGAGIELAFSRDALEADFVVNLPVLKTHAQTVVSLGIKNLKGLIDIASRKKCHNTDPVKDLHFMVARLADAMPPMLTLIDGIYSTERGPGIDGRIHRSDILAASRDVLSVDLVGAKLLGQEPEAVPHLVHAAKNRRRPLDLSDLEMVGERIEDLAKPHQWAFPYNEAGTLPLPMEKMGIQGLSCPKYDLSLCTYCSALVGVIISSIAYAWQGKPFNEIEVLTGKSAVPTMGMNKTILVGKCMYQANKDHPHIKEMLAIKGCPPKPEQVADALHQAGIMVDRAIFENIEMAPAIFMKRYQDRPEFDMGLFRVA